MLTTSFSRHKGDYAGVFVYELAKALAERDNEVTVVAPHDKKAKRKEELALNISVRRFMYFFPARWQCVAYSTGILENIA